MIHLSVANSSVLHFAIQLVAGWLVLVDKSFDIAAEDRKD